MRNDSLTLARLLALAVPVALLGGALGSQFIGHLVPCEMCVWQRWPHLAAILLALAAFFVQPRAIRSMLIWLAAIAIAISGAIGVFHAGVEYHWWQGITECTRSIGASGSTDDLIAAMMHAPIVRCDQAQWTLFGISLAGFNAIFSLSGAAAVFALLARGRRA